VAVSGSRSCKSEHEKQKRFFSLVLNWLLSLFTAIKSGISKTLMTVKEIWAFEKPISEIYQVKSNAFDVLRFIMASLVIVHHAYDLLGVPNANLFVRFTGGQLNLGSLAVGNFL
jgi:hypothetical protein